MKKADRFPQAVATVRPLWLLAGLLIVLFVAYAPALRSPFVFDDIDAIEGNPTIRQLVPLSAPLHPPTATALEGRPIVNLSLAIDHAITSAAGLDGTIIYHSTNILLHLLAGSLLLGVLRRSFRRQRYSEEWRRFGDVIAAGLTAVWMVHPMQTEAIDYVVQRTEIIASACYLGTLYTWIRGVESDVPGRRRAWLAASLLICGTGMLSKEMMISAPIAVVLYERAFVVERWRGLGARAPWLLALTATMAIAIVGIASGARSDSVGFHLGITWYEYLYTQAWAILHYVRLTLWPSGLNLDYGTRPIRGLGGVPGLLVLSAFLGVTVAAWLRAERWGWLAFVGSAFFLILGPSSSVVPIVTEVAAERRFYLAQVCLLILITASAQWLFRRMNWSLRRGPVLTTVSALVLVLASATFARTTTYRTNELVWRDATQKAPDNARAFSNLAYTIADQGPHRLVEAESLFSKAIAIDSTFAAAWIGKARVQPRVMPWSVPRMARMLNGT